MKTFLDILCGLACIGVAALIILAILYGGSA